jgi:hypothetical protein
MEVVDNRKVSEDGEIRIPEPEEKYDDFSPTLGGFKPLFDAVLLRELHLPADSIIVAPDAFAEECLYCEVIAIADSASIASNMVVGETARVIKGVGTTILFSDTEPGQRYFTVNVQDIIGKWSRQ